MKNLRAFNLLFFIMVPAVALQGQVTVKLHQPSPNQLTVADLWWVNLSNAGRNPVTVYLHAEVTEAREGTVARASSNTFQMPVGQKRMQSRDITATRDLWYLSDYGRYVLQGQQFPAGHYTICLSVIDAQNNRELGRDCIRQTVAPMGSPRLIAPLNGSALTERYPFFSWLAPVSGASGQGIRYRLKIAEIVPGQSSDEAMGSNNPWFEARDLSVTSLRYPQSARPFEPGKEYCWGVEAWANGATVAGSDVWRLTVALPRTPVAGTPVLRPPTVALTRTVTRDKNHFRVALRVKNIGGEKIQDISVTDWCYGFQPTAGNVKILGPAPKTTFAPPWFHYDRLTQKNQVVLGWSGVIDPGSEVEFQYFAVPILWSPSWADDEYTIGIGKTRVGYKTPDGDFSGYFKLPYNPGGALTEACHGADYLIVTNPWRGSVFYGAAEDTVLTNMAELAYQKEGVLGYTMKYSDPAEEKSIIADWGTKLSPGWATGSGYLLLVGETELIPSFFFPKVYKVRDGWWDVRISDFPYEDINNDGQPEVKVGRILGRTGRELVTPIKASIDVAEGRATNHGNRALLVSGPEGYWECFVKSIERGKSTLAALGVGSDVVHAEYFDTKKWILAVSLAILGSDGGGSAAEPVELDSGYSIKQLAYWLSCSDDLKAGAALLFISDFIDVKHKFRTVIVPTSFSDADLDQAVEKAEGIQTARPNRGGDYGWKYSYFPDGVACQSERMKMVKKFISPKDMVVYTGHGNVNVWGGVLADAWGAACSIEPIDFGKAVPFVLAYSCLTGNYEGGTSIARAFLRNGAAAYVGATEVSLTAENDEATAAGFWDGWSHYTRIGVAHLNFQKKQLKAGRRFFVYEYNLYGDPKFAGTP